MRILRKCHLCSELFVPFLLSFVIFVATPFAADFTLQWDVPLEWDIAGYKIYYDTDESGPEYEGTGADQGNSPIVTQTTNPAGLFYIDPGVASPQFSITGLPDGQVYYFSVTTYDSRDMESIYALEIDTLAPQITSTPTVTGVTDTTATIVWNTDKPGTSVVEYGLDTDYLGPGSPKTLSAYVTSHSVTVTGLSPGTLYHFRVSATNEQGLGPESSDVDNNPSIDYTFATDGVGDTTPPVITAQPTAVDIASSSVRITWQTNEPSDSVVQYGLTESYGSTQSDPADVSSHSVVVNGLSPVTTYQFRVSSTDISNNGPTYSGKYTFATIAVPDTVPPVIVSGPTVTGVTDTTAIVSWQTDEPATSIVEYGKTTPYARLKTLTGYDVNHAVTLTLLESQTLYHFRAGSTDEEGNGPRYTGDGTFTTEAPPDIQAPVITSPPTPVDITFTTATIEWETDEPSNSQVRYDTTMRTWSSYTYTKSDAGMDTTHGVTLTGLSNGQRYYFRVGSTDALGNGPDKDAGDNNPFSEVSFITETAADEDAPTILTGPTATGIDNTSAIITWTTDESANSIVQYGTVGSTWGNYYWTRSSASLTTNHVVVVTGLQPLLKYYFTVGSIDAVGNGPDWHPSATNPSSEKSFTTTDGPDLLAPIIVTGPVVTHVTNKTALIEWSTDEPSNSIVAYGIESDAWEDYPFREEDDPLTTQHSITITGLQPNKPYWYRVGSVDSRQNGPDRDPADTNPSDEKTFTSAIGPDETAPQVLSLEITTLSDTAAKIDWTTDEPGNSQVQFDTQSHLWNSYAYEENDAGLTTQHSVTLTNLSPSTLYYARVSSTDATGNNYLTSPTDRNPSIEKNLTTSAADPPSIVVYPDTPFPSIDFDGNIIDITFDELNMQYAENAENYILPPGLDFAAVDDPVVHIGSSNGMSTYRLFLAAIDPYTIVTLTVLSPVTDADGFSVVPNIVVINDKDGDDLPDDWEEANGLLSTSSDISAGEGRDGDKDGDGYSNYEEFFYSTDPDDDTSTPSPPEILQVLPHQQAGIVDTSRVPNNSSFAVLIEDSAGIDIATPTNVVFAIDDGTTTYEVNLGQTAVVRTIVMDNGDPDAPIEQLWVVYDRSLDESIAATTAGRMWSFATEVSVTVTVTNAIGQITVDDYSFRVETELEHDEAADPVNLPAFETLEAGDPAFTDSTHTYDAGFRLTAGDLTGAKLVYNSADIMPVLGPTEELPAFNVSNATAVGESINLQPPNVFSTPVKLVMPTPGQSSASNVSIFLYDGEAWVLGCDTAGDSPIEGWMVPGSRLVSGSSIQLKVWHFSGIQAAVVTQPVVPPTNGGDEPNTPDDMATCFIGQLLIFK